MELFLPVLFGCIVGLSLGLTGGGGSIFAIPLLIYGLDMTLTDAVPVSLVAVALTAAIGAWYSWRAGLLLWLPILLFAAGGVIAAPAGIYLSRYFEVSTLITGFSLLTLVIGLAMWKKSISRPHEAGAVRALAIVDDKGPMCRFSADGKLRVTTPCALILFLAGIVTGLLSGLFGVGGGFLIVPALIFVIELGIHRAVAASLMIITFIGTSGSVSILLTGALPWPVLLPFIAGSIAGMLAGRLFAARIAGPRLQQLFATAILATGTGMLLRTLIN